MTRSLLTSMVLLATLAHAQPPPPQTPENRGHFSGKRFIVNALAGTVIGGAAGYGVYRAAGGDSLGAAFAGLGANVVVTPLAVYGIGRAMDGEGTVGSAYYGALTGLSAPGTYAAQGDQYMVCLAIGVAIMPITSALFYEASSNLRSRTAATVVGGLSVAPVVTDRGVGARAGLAFRF
jgi:hypothetical protein